MIETASDNVFSKTEDDWNFVYETVPTVFQKLHQDGYKIVIFTNQMGIEKGLITEEALAKKMRCFQSYVRTIRPMC